MPNGLCVFAVFKTGVECTHRLTNSLTSKYSPMSSLARIFAVFTLLVAFFGLPACRPQHADAVDNFVLSRIFPSDANPAVHFVDSINTAPILHAVNGQMRLIVPVFDGTLATLDAGSGALLWQQRVPVPTGQQALLVASPVQVGDLLVVIYQSMLEGVRLSHNLAVLDLANNRWHPDFPVLTFAAQKPTADGKNSVTFNPANAYAHAALKSWRPNSNRLGWVYAGFGNAADQQPFHGWLFEVDLDAWQRHELTQAMNSLLLTTPEAECPVTLEYGTQEMVCAGGIWAPAGPLLTTSNGEAHLFVTTGNGQVDLARQDYANSVLKITLGRPFEAGCDPHLCANFNPLKPSTACLESCKNVFIPRPMPGEAPLRPTNGECDNRDFWECLAWMDYDLGASPPVKVTLADGRSVLVQPGKDGAAYLIDADHLGIQYDRLQIAALCGSPTDLCKLSWAGMIVTQPLHTSVAGEQVVIIPTFSPDQTHIAGVVAVKITLNDGKPKLEPFWHFPEAGYPGALKMFRSHPSFPVLTTHLGRQRDAVIWLVDVGKNGTLYGIRAKDGRQVAKQTLQGSGRQLSFPQVSDDKIYVASRLPSGKAFIEAYRIEQAK